MLLLVFVHTYGVVVVFGLHKFSLQATIVHHGPYMYSGHYTASINCWKKFHFYDSKIAEFDYVMVLTKSGGWEFNYPYGAGTYSSSH